jgi:hypothetical protein
MREAGWKNRGGEGAGTFHAGLELSLQECAVNLILATTMESMYFCVRKHVFHILAQGKKTLYPTIGPSHQRQKILYPLIVSHKIHETWQRRSRIHFGNR